MRGLLLASLLIVTALAGCTNGDKADDPDSVRLTLTLDDVTVPEGATANQTLEGVNLEWPGVSLPFEQTITLPQGATMVQVRADPGAGSVVSLSMWNEETGRRRCNQQTVLDLGQSLTGAKTCSNIAALDPPGTEWTIRATGAPTADVRVEFFSKPVDGIAGMLNLSQLSHATHKLQDTQYLLVDSWDGTPLWTEVTLPEGEGPWPTVIAASPYNGQVGRGQTPAMWEYWTQDWAMRGYAAVNVDVRGFGMSGGCVEVWGEKEQKDQSFIVDWVSQQDWSDGNVGFYGQSYVGTTPVEAAVQAPDALKAIIAVAPVINSYEDWHYGGVPNGESSLSPVSYQVLTDTPNPQIDPTQTTELAGLIEESTKGVCDPTLVPLANDPRAIYNDFYATRDFKARVQDVQAAVLFTEGFEDANVKSAMIPGWFNELQSPKLGVFGHWLHQHPARMDQEILFLGWMDQYVKGKDLGFDRLPAAVVNVDGQWHRQTDSWPAVGAEERTFGLDLGAGALGEGAGSADLVMTPVSGTADIPQGSIVLQGTVAEEMPLINPRLHLEGSVAGENGFVYARLEETTAGGETRVLTWGMLNLALRNGYDSYEPLVPASAVSADLPFRPTEHMVGAGSTLTLTIRGVEAGEALGVAQPQPAVFSLDGSGSALVVPTLPLSAYEALPVSAMP